MDATNRTTNPTTSLVPLKNHCAVRQPSDRQSGPLPCRSAANVPQRLTLVDPPAAIAAPPLPGPAPAPAASGRQPESAPYRPPAAQISHPVCAATPQLPQQIRHIANTDVTAPFTASPADSNYPRHNLARNNRRQPQISQQSLMQACIQTQLDQLLRLDPDQIPATFKNTLVLMAETARDKNQPQFDAAREQHYAMAQATTAEQRSQARLEPEAGVAKEEQIAAHHFTVIENDPFASGSGYADCLLFA
ncbi:hypothetical protein, partial [Pantoea sp. B65]|uniref:hypothetical protein n=1 Tax=Pantoea sp. B65 TaxID=2813359 RepID=UPI0039B5BC47